jgi:hypothetical protein
MLRKLLSFLSIPIVFFVIIFMSEYCSISEAERAVDEIASAVAKKMRIDRGLHVVGTGGGMMHGIEMLHMGFHYYREVGVDEARELLIYAVDEYEAAINSSLEIRQNLKEYPFKSTEIVIYFYRPDRSKVPHGEISVVAARENRTIEYFMHPSDEIGCRMCVHLETYDEAQELLRKRRSEETQASNRELTAAPTDLRPNAS